MRLVSLLRRSAVAVALLACSLATAHAATEAPFTHDGFVAAQSQGKPILIEVDASWCPTCAQQRPILAKLKEDPAFADLQILKLDFDTQKADWSALGVRMQSTLIVFTGAAEKGRSVGDTNAASIRALLEKSHS